MRHHSRAVKKRVQRRRLFAEPLEERRLLAVTQLAELLPAMRPEVRLEAFAHAHSADDLQQHGELHHFHTINGQTYEAAALPLPAGAEPDTGATLEAASESLHPLSSIPALNSLPGAPATLYLDFNGHFEAEWGAYSNITTPVYDADGDASTFSDAELNFIQTLWADVAEDYAPFNINVTTVEPPELAAGVPSSAADGRALRVAIGGSSADWLGGNYSGYAYIGSFTNYIPNVVYVFAGGRTTAITHATIASHEAGHGLGLFHQVNNHVDSQARQSAIMWSLNFGYEHTYWHSDIVEDGTHQDDMAIIAGPTNGFGYRADDHGDTVASATPLTDTGSGLTASGIIGTNSDVDLFAVPAGSYLLSLEGHSPGQNLDAVLELRDASGAVLLTADPGDSLNASLIGGGIGTTYVAVRSTGQYGRVGQYTLTATPTTPGVSVVSSDAPLTTSELGRSETIMLSLNARPTADVTFEVASSDPSEGAVSTSQLTYTPENWFIPQPVVITGQADDIVDGAAGFSVIISPASSSDPAYDGLIDPDDLEVVNLDQAEGHLYWMSYNGNTDVALIERATLTGDDAQAVVDIPAVFGPPATSYYTPSSIAVDPSGGKIYWTDVTNGSIRRANQDGSAPQTLLTGLRRPDGLAIDAAGGKMYWVDSVEDTIQRANLDGSGVETLVTEGLGTADQLMLDVAAGKMYWNDTSNRTLTRANLDGSNREIVRANDGVNRVQGFAVDASGGKLYFALRNNTTANVSIYRANLDGSAEEFLIDAHAVYRDNIVNVTSMAIDPDSGRLYWTTSNGPLFSANLDGSLVATIARVSGAQLTGLAILPPTPGVTVASQTELVTTEAGGAANFSVVLDSRPAADVTIPIVSTDPGEGSVSTSSLLFTPANWDIPQVVTITGVDELLDDGDVGYSIELGPATSADAAYHGREIAALSVTNLDNDAPLFADSFEVGEWNGLWVEDSQNDWFRSTQRSTEGVRSAEVDGSASNATLTMANGIDLTPYGSAELSFSWYIESGFDRNEYLAVDVFNGTWREVARLRGNSDPENVWHHETIEIAGGDLVSNFKIRFRASVSGSSEDANVDNVVIAATSFAGPPNQLPTASAGGPYAGVEGSAAMLSGAESFDTDGNIVSYEWDFDDDGQYDDASGASPAFFSRADGVHSVHLRVTDDRGGMATASTTVTLANVAPLASAGGAYAGSEGDVIALSAAGSAEPGQDIVSYAWDLDGDGQYDDAAGVNASFTATEDGVFTVGVRVTDDRGASSTDSAVVTVANVAPTADAGGPYAAFVGQEVVLSAAGSTDPGNDIASYTWDLDGDGQYDDATGASVAFPTQVPDSYTVSVRVTDDDGASSTATTIVEISEVPSETVVFADSFEQGQWNGRWVENNQNDWFTSTQRKTDGNYSAEVDGRASDATLTLATPLDLTGYASAELTFDWLIESSFDRGEYVALDVFDGSTWISNVRRLNGNQSQENAWHRETVDLSPWLSSNTLIRFRASVSGSDEDANVDNVRIIAAGAAQGSLTLAAASFDEATVASLDASSLPQHTSGPAASDLASSARGRARHRAPQASWKSGALEEDVWQSLLATGFGPSSSLPPFNPVDSKRGASVQAATREAFGLLGDQDGVDEWLWNREGDYPF